MPFLGLYPLHLHDLQRPSPHITPFPMFDVAGTDIVVFILCKGFNSNKEFFSKLIIIIKVPTPNAFRLFALLTVLQIAGFQL